MCVCVCVCLIHTGKRAKKPSFKLYLPTDLFATATATQQQEPTVEPLNFQPLNQSQAATFACNIGKLDFKANFVAGGSCGTGSNTNPIATTTGQSNSICSINSLSPNSDGTASQQHQQQQQQQHQFQQHQQNQQPFNIFPAIFSRQLNFSAAAAAAAAAQQTSKLMMDDLRPNLVGGLLGLQQGLLDDHLAHGNLQHHHYSGSGSGGGGGGGSGSSTSHHSQEHSKFMSTLQDSNRCLMGITTHENHRLLGLSSHDLRSAATINNLDNSSKNSTSIGGGGGGGQGGRKCSSTPEDFSALYGGLTASALGDTAHHHHHHTPAHTPPSSRLDHSITGKIKQTLDVIYAHRK